MESLIEISNLSDLNLFKSTCRVHVKVLHTWEFINLTNGSSLEMVLTDETVSSAHKPFVFKIAKLLIYELSASFIVS